MNSNSNDTPAPPAHLQVQRQLFCCEHRSDVGVGEVGLTRDQLLDPSPGQFRRRHHRGVSECDIGPARECRKLGAGVCTVQQNAGVPQGGACYVSPSSTSHGGPSRWCAGPGYNLRTSPTPHAHTAVTHTHAHGHTHTHTQLKVPPTRLFPAPPFAAGPDWYCPPHSEQGRKGVRKGDGMW